MFVTVRVTFSLFRNWVKISLIAFLFFMFISVEFLASLYVQGEQTYSIEDGEKIVSVIVDRTMYTLSPEAMKMFEDIHDDWELSICEKFPHDVLIGGIYTQIYILKAQYRPLCFAPLWCCFGFDMNKVSIVFDFYSGGKQKNPQNFQHHKNGRQDIAACSAYWEKQGLY